MGLIVGVVGFLVVLAVLAGLIERGAASGMLRPYIGLLLISGVIAGMGLLLGFLSSDVQGIFFMAAKVLAVLVGVALCAHLIIVIAKRWL